MVLIHGILVLNATLLTFCIQIGIERVQGQESRPPLPREDRTTHFGIPRRNHCWDTDRGFKFSGIRDSVEFLWDTRTVVKNCVYITRKEKRNSK